MSRGPRRSRPLVVLVLVGMLFAVAGAAGWWFVRRPDAQVHTAADAPLREQCPEVDAHVIEAARRETLTGSGGDVLGAVATGPEAAAAALLWRPGASQTLCEWLPWAVGMSRDTGAEVFIFDRRGKGSSSAFEPNLGLEVEDTRRAYARLREKGIEHVAVGGSSMGNSIAFASLDGLEPPPCAVLSVSPVLTSSDSHGTVDGRTPTLIDNVWIAYETEGMSSIPANVQDLQAESRRQGLATPRVLAVDTDAHSRQLVLSYPQVGDFLTEAMTMCSRP
ncbi:MAG: hypothetical protein ACK5MT_03780 [Actinomycetales bacterium]